MTTVTSLTADRMLAIEAASVVDGDVDVNGNLILTKHDGSKINAGSVIGPTGPQGPVGSMLPVLAARTVQDIGLSNQIRAGRQLTAADFGAMGLSAPLGLWNLSDLTDVSGNGRNLLNKGAVRFDIGINGGVNTAAQFSGNTGQALYIPDTGAADPFRIKTGSWGGWTRTAKIGSFQLLMSKYTTSLAWYIGIANNVASTQISLDGSTWANPQVLGASVIADDRWHFLVATHDGARLSIYVDGILEGVGLISGMIAGAGVPFNIGSAYADGGTASVAPHFGRVDEAFVTADVLSEDQIRNLYCAKIPHTLGVAPTRVSLNVRRRRRGAALAAADFPTQPLRLHNFSAGSLGDEGSNGVALTNNGAALAVAGVDGSGGNAFYFNGAQNLSSTDAGLPSALATRSYGAWFKTSYIAVPIVLMMWGNSDLQVSAPVSGCITSQSGSDAITGPWVADGQWHFAVVTEYNAVGSPTDDGIKRKLYLDGRLVAMSTVLNAIVLGGANKFRIAADTSGNSPFTGQIDGAFVCGYALTAEQIATLYAKSLLALVPSPKNVGDHIEAMDAASLLATFDTLDTNAQVDVGVAA